MCAAAATRLTICRWQCRCAPGNACVHKFTSSQVHVSSAVRIACCSCRPGSRGSESSQTGALKVPNIKLRTCQHVEQQLLHNKRVYSAKLELHACQPLS